MLWNIVTICCNVHFFASIPVFPGMPPSPPLSRIKQSGKLGFSMAMMSLDPWLALSSVTLLMLESNIPSTSSSLSLMQFPHCSLVALAFVTWCLFVCKMTHGLIRKQNDEFDRPRLKWCTVLVQHRLWKSGVTSHWQLCVCYLLQSFVNWDSSEVCTLLNFSWLMYDIS